MQATPNATATTEGPAADDDAAPAGRVARFGAAVRGRFAQLRVAAASVLGRLRGGHAAGAGESESPARTAGESGHRADRAAAPESTAPDNPAPRRWRRLPAYVAAILAGALVAGAGAYWFFSGHLDRQAAETKRQQDELARQQALVAGYEKILVQESRKAESERERLISREKSLDREQRQLAQDRAGLEEASKQFARLPDPPGSPFRAGASTAAAPPTKASSGTPAAGNCEVHAGSVSTSLKACIDEFNRAQR